MKLQVDGHPNLYRDENTNAIINSNLIEYNNYMEIKRLKDQESKRVDNIENDLNHVKSELGEIKNLLRGILDGIK